MLTKIREFPQCRAALPNDYQPFDYSSIGYTAPKLGKKLKRERGRKVMLNKHHQLPHPHWPPYYRTARFNHSTQHITLPFSSEAGALLNATIYKAANMFQSTSRGLLYSRLVNALHDADQVMRIPDDGSMAHDERSASSGWLHWQPHDPHTGRALCHFQRLYI